VLLYRLEAAKAAWLCWRLSFYGGEFGVAW